MGIPRETYLHIVNEGHVKAAETLSHAWHSAGSIHGVAGGLVGRQRASGATTCQRQTKSGKKGLR